MLKNISVFMLIILIISVNCYAMEKNLQWNPGSGDVVKYNIYQAEMLLPQQSDSWVKIGEVNHPTSTFTATNVLPVDDTPPNIVEGVVVIP